MEHDFLGEVLVLLAISVITITVFGRFRVPAIISYLVVGIIAGPHALAWIQSSDTTRLLGEIGVVFLLFTIGLDFSIAQLRQMKKPLFGLGGAQVLAGTISGGLIAWWLGIAWQGALIVGGALALSSTAIVVKQLGDQLELQTEHGRLSFSILLFQDLAAVPFLVLIPLLAQGEVSYWILFITLLKGFAALVAILLFGRWALRPLFHEVAKSHSLELFTLTALLISLAAAWITHKMGLSLALGAFLAGMMLSETEFRHQIAIEIRPFRDILLGLFFITVGMQLDLSQLPDVWFWVLLLVGGVMLGKSFFIFLLLRIFGYGATSSLRTGLILGQGGEFGIALLILAVISGLLTTGDTQPILMAIILSMLLTPVIIKFNSKIPSLLFGQEIPQAGRENAQQIKASAGQISNHVVVCGFGHVGQTIAETLYQQEIEFIGLDTNPEIIKQAWQDGDPVYFGDVTNEQILEAAGLRNASAIIICLDNPISTLNALSASRKVAKEVPVIVRARDGSDLDKLLEAGADEVITEKLETGIMMSTRLLLLLNRSPEKVFEYIKSFRDQQERLFNKNIS